MATAPDRFENLVSNPIVEIRQVLLADRPDLTTDVADLHRAFELLWDALDTMEAHLSKWAPSLKVEDSVNAKRWEAAALALTPERIAEISEPSLPTAA